MVEIFKKISQIDLQTISEKDLEILLPEFGMNSELTCEQPSELSEHFGKGIRFWQYPNQLSPYLKQLSKYRINSYLEIGCRWGGTFIITRETLRKYNRRVDGFACDMMPISKILKEYKTYNDFTYFQSFSSKLSRKMINQNVDLILIDGDHSYEGLKRDFELCKQFNPKYVSFHDICSDSCEGVVKFWNEIKGRYKHYEFTDQYDSVKGTFLGIGLIEL